MCCPAVPSLTLRVTQTYHLISESSVCCSPPSELLTEYSFSDYYISIPHLASHSPNFLFWSRINRSPTCHGVWSPTPCPVCPKAENSRIRVRIKDMMEFLTCLNFQNKMLSEAFVFLRSSVHFCSFSSVIIGLFQYLFYARWGFFSLFDGSCA